MNARNTLILGLGKTGYELALYLSSHRDRFPSITLYTGTAKPEVIADKVSHLEKLGVTVVANSSSVSGNFALCITSPGISVNSDFYKSAAAAAQLMLGEPEFAYRESPEKWLAITGTNGKTTTTTLTNLILNEAGLKALAVGNIGNLATSELDNRDGAYFVAELSSFQLEETVDFHPHAACLLNITPDHIEWHGSLAAYAAAKEKIFANLGADDFALISLDDAYSLAIAKRLKERNLKVIALSSLPSRARAFSDSWAACVEGTLTLCLEGKLVEFCTQEELPIKGSHNVLDALAAATMGYVTGADLASIKCALLAFEPLAHRIEPVAEVLGVNFVNDSKATNTDSVEKALTAFKRGHIVLLLGGYDKGTSLSSLAFAVNRSCKAAICFGAAGKRIECALAQSKKEMASKLVIQRAEGLRSAFDLALEAAEAGDCVLLSPACSSFDEFNNMAERGNFFKELVFDYQKRCGNE